MNRKREKGSAMLLMLGALAVLLILSGVALRIVMSNRKANVKAKAELRESARAVLLYCDR